MKEISTEIGKGIASVLSFGLVQEVSGLFLELLLEMVEKENIFKKKFRRN